MSSETSQIGLQNMTWGICLCTSTPTAVPLPEGTALRYTVWVMGDEQYLREVNGLSWKNVIVWENKQKRPCRVALPCFVFSRISSFLLQMGRKRSFPNSNVSPPQQRDKGQHAGRQTCLWSSNQEDHLKAILAARLCLRKSLFLSVPKGLPRSHFWSHTEIWTICWFHPLNTCSWIPRLCKPSFNSNSFILVCCYGISKTKQRKPLFSNCDKTS